MQPTHAHTQARTTKRSETAKVFVTEDEAKVKERAEALSMGNKKQDEQKERK